jgi:hypothetical protein
MSAAALAQPQPIQQEQGLKEITQQEIAERAYALWLQRGSPGGSPEEDWIAAEQLLLSEQQTT